MLKLIILLLCCLSASLVVAKHELYDGHTLYDVNVKVIDQVRYLANLQNQVNLDIWSLPMVGSSGKVLVSKEQKDWFKNTMQEAGIDVKVDVENIKEYMDLEDTLFAAARSKSRSIRSSSGGLSFDVIHNYTVVYDYIEQLARDYPEKVTLVHAGNSVEDRPIKYLKISSSNFEDRNKPIVLLQSLIHAREWITLPATLYAIEQLVLNVTEPDLIQNIDWIILPIVNPDGYVWSHENNRFWRKNRARGFVAGDSCMGVDLNRNYNINWGTASSTNVCTETFHGSGPFSEPETAVVRDIFREYNVDVYQDIHSHGSMILFGWGNGTLPANALILNLVGVNQAQAIDRVKWEVHPNYVVGNMQFVLYATSGTASDFGSAAGATLSYTYELPTYRFSTGGTTGFLVEPEFIWQAGFETWEGLKVAARYVAENNRRKNNMEN